MISGEVIPTGAVPWHSIQAKGQTIDPEELKMHLFERCKFTGKADLETVPQLCTLQRLESALPDLHLRIC